MSMQVIAADLREAGKKSNNRRLRQTGRIPAVFYGPKVTNQPIWVDEKKLMEQIRQHGRTGLFHIRIGDGEPQLVMLKEVQEDMFRPGRILHVDLYRVVEDQPVDAVLPLEFEGEPKGIKAGGVLQIQTTEVEVRCLPKDLPAHLTVPISHLDVGDHLYARDLQLPAGVELLTDPDELLLTVLEVHQAEGAAEAEPAGTAQ